MKHHFVALLLIGNVFLCKFGYTQSIEETRRFIIETIENNSLKNHRLKAEFTPNTTILNHYRLNVDANGEINFSYNSAFAVDGINYIREGSEYQTCGTLAYKILIYIKPGYFRKEQLGTTRLIKHPDFISIYLDSRSELKRIKRALIHLCKLYGGTPREENLFSE